MKTIKITGLAIGSILLTQGVMISCGSRYYSEEDFARIPKIDTHIHINSESNAFAEQAKTDNFQLLTVNVDVADYPALADQGRFARFQVEKFPAQIRFLTAFDLKGWDSAWADRTIAKLKSDFQDGALGVKIWKNIGMVYKDSSGHFIMIDHPRFDPVVEYIISQDKTVMGHLGEPKNCWMPLEEMTVNNDKNYFKEHPQYHMYLHPEYPTYEDQINARDRFLERHPNMRFVGAHLGSLEWDVNELAKRLDKFQNMAVDVAARVPHLQYQSQKDREKVRNLIIKYQDRLIYGSDSGMGPSSDPEKAKKHLHDAWLSDWKYFTSDVMMTVGAVNGEFQGLRLPTEVVDKLYHHNAVKWFKLRPSKL